MKRIQDFFKNNKDAVIWTICYFTVVWIVLLILFKFNVFSLHHWSILFSAQLTGFPGFVFGILLLAIIPIYVATTSIIWRTKKPLINIPFVHKKAEKKEDKKNEEKKPEEDEKPLPENIPSELRGAFLRARHTAGERSVSAFTMQDVTNVPDVNSFSESASENVGLPLPDDFDLDAIEPSSDEAPVFKEINFGSPNTEPADEAPPLVKHLKNKNYPYENLNDIILTNELAIITHDDSAFWIADNDNWFAAGKQKPSPVLTVLDVAREHDLKPVIYLSEKNIMDLETRTQEWEELGVWVITDLNDI